ncbi:hypothetical protein C923_02155 [Plasmodium falciparum UGT5.1]|uniref:Uncharacterized protein n=1 Tax=Plasmodium falciparum UGT5.1 TaxID=1237627 RepID=W7JQ68_PLAFA|nr:hypothetical protein C923_02155 [Plasmodium falciparum UGT5.1]
MLLLFYTFNFTKCFRTFLLPHLHIKYIYLDYLTVYYFPF